MLLNSTGKLPKMGSNILDYETLNARRLSGKLADVILVIKDTEFQAHKVCIYQQALHSESTLIVW